MSERTYLDYNATAPLRPEAKAVMIAALALPHNASSVHSFGREAHRLVEMARTQVAALVSAPPAQVIFNSGATESNNTVLHHFAGEKILVSSIEHPSILEACPAAKHIPVTQDGVVDLNALEDLLQKEKPALVSVMRVNNETGILQPLAEISALSKKHGALVHCDAVQAAGRIAINMQDLGIDFLSLSSHKIGGPQGAGALVLGLCGITPTLLLGGGQEKSARAGTENVAGIAGFGAAAQAARKTLPDFQMLAVLRDALEKDIAALTPQAKFYGQNQARATNTSMFSLPGASSETLLMALDLEGIALSNGSACSSGRVTASHVLSAMGASKDEASGALRISLGWNSTPADIDSFLKAWKKITARLDTNRKAAHA